MVTHAKERCMGYEDFYQETNPIRETFLQKVMIEKYGLTQRGRRWVSPLNEGVRLIEERKVRDLCRPRAEMWRLWISVLRAVGTQ